MWLARLLSTGCVSLLLSLFSCALLFIGYLGRTAILNKNPCGMTYSSVSSYQIQVENTMSGYNLWRNDHPKKGVLNDIPVLFIPGSNGRMGNALIYTVQLGEPTSLNIRANSRCYLILFCIIFNTISTAQARSFSSSLHNDGSFQYFVANLGNEWSALHGSTVLRQAAFVNYAAEVNLSVCFGFQYLDFEAVH